MRWTESDEGACFVPALLTGGPQPFAVAVGASRVADAAQAPHWCTYSNVAIIPVDGVALPSKWEPDKRPIGVGHWHLHSLYLTGVAVLLGTRGATRDNAVVAPGAGGLG